MSKTIIYLDIRKKTTCTVCNGTGEVVSDVDTIAEYSDAYVYVCYKCGGKGYKMKKQTVSLEQFKKLKN